MWVDGVITATNNTSSVDMVRVSIVYIVYHRLHIHKVPTVWLKVQLVFAGKHKLKDVYHKAPESLPRAAAACTWLRCARVLADV